MLLCSGVATIEKARSAAHYFIVEYGCLAVGCYVISIDNFFSITYLLFNELTYMIYIKDNN